MAKSQTKRTLKDEDEGDPWFNPYRHPTSDNGWLLVSSALDDLERHQKRKRARKTKDRHWLWNVVTALVADLTHQQLDGSPGSGLVVPRANRALKKIRYHDPIFTRLSQGCSMIFRSSVISSRQKVLTLECPGSRSGPQSEQECS